MRFDFQSKQFYWIEIIIPIYERRSDIFKVFYNQVLYYTNSRDILRKNMSIIFRPNFLGIKRFEEEWIGGRVSPPPGEKYAIARIVTRVPRVIVSGSIAEDTSRNAH